MKKNEGTADRIIRVIIAIALAWISYTYLSGAWNIVVYIIAIISLVTGLIGHCGLYSLFGVSTNKKCDACEK